MRMGLVPFGAGIACRLIELALTLPENGVMLSADGAVCMYAMFITCTPDGVSAANFVRASSIASGARGSGAEAVGHAACVPKASATYAPPREPLRATGARAAGSHRARAVFADHRRRACGGSGGRGGDARAEVLDLLDTGIDRERVGREVVADEARELALCALGAVERVERVRERVAEFGGVLEALGGIFLQRLLDDGPQLGREAGHELDERLRLVLQHRVHRLDGVRAAEEALQARALVEHDAEREEVGARVDLSADDLLGRHVARLSADGADVALVVLDRRARDAEVREAHGAVGVEQDVVRRDVAVDQLERLPWNEARPFA
jgi:hypothetical protein